MGHLRPVQPVKPIAGIIAKNTETIAQTQTTLEQAWGPVDGQSPVIPFTFSDYYNREMGEGLLRCWFSFERLIAPDALVAMKHAANSFENDMRCNGNRTVNIDPGYQGLSKLVLASTKDFSHRIYIADQIYEEITLLFRAHAFHALPWSYADYQSETCIQFLTETRNKLLAQLNLESQ